MPVKKVLIILLALCILAGAAAFYLYTNYNVDNILAGHTEIITETFQWEISGDTAFIAGIGTVAHHDILIPQQIYLSERDGTYIEDPLQGKLYSVGVRSTAFANCDQIHTVTFADGVTIEDNRMANEHTGMFTGCENLVSVSNIPNDVTFMADTFENCYALKNVDRLPEALTNLERCFYGCASLEEVPAIPAGVEAITECFYDCVSLRSVGPIYAAATDFSSVFYNCQALEVAPELPDTVKNMYRCFYGCTSLTTVTSLPAKLADMTETFAGCSGMKVFQVNIPRNVTVLNRTFSNCTGLEEFLGKCGDKAKDMSHTFENCSSLVRLAHPLPDRVLTMYKTFYGCSALQELPGGIPKNVTNLEQTFYNCASLAEIEGELSDSITNMTRSFYNCSSLKSIPVLSYKLLERHLNIDTECFSGCAALKEIRVNSCNEVSLAKCSFRSKIVFLQEHIASGICSFCNSVTGKFEVDGLEVWFWDIPTAVYLDCINALKNTIPQELKDANHFLAIIAKRHWESYLHQFCTYTGTPYDPIWSDCGGLNITINYVSYSSASVHDNNRDGELEWDESELRTVAHELGHGYDFYCHPKISPSPEWLKLHQTEGEIIRKKYYDEDMYLALSDLDRYEETFAMAVEGYFGNPHWLKSNCPQMYAFMDELWGNK